MCLNKNFAIDMPNYLFRSFDDPGPHGAGRYSEHMLPEIVKKDWRKGAQVIYIFLYSDFFLASNNPLFSKFNYL